MKRCAPDPALRRDRRSRLPNARSSAIGVAICVTGRYAGADEFGGEEAVDRRAVMNDGVALENFLLLVFRRPRALKRPKLLARQQLVPERHPALMEMSERCSRCGSKRVMRRFPGLHFSNR
jgi:hypothetical protein